MEKYAFVVMNYMYQGFSKNPKRSVVCSRLAKWASKLSIVTCSVAGSTGDLHFEIKKAIYIIAVLIIVRLQTV